MIDRVVDQINGSLAQTHAFVVGVGNYPHLIGGSEYASKASPKRAKYTFGMKQLTSPPVSAAHFATWLRDRYKNPAAPLGSVDLLVSERASDPFLGPDGSPAPVAAPTFANIHQHFKRWAATWGKNPGDIALFFFSGHGVLIDGQTLLLPEDFGADRDDPLHNAVRFQKTMMDLNFARTARAQVSFIDCCRQRSTEVPMDEDRSRPLIADHEASIRNPGSVIREAPVYYSAAKGHYAGGIEREASNFTQNLIRCFDKFGAKLDPADERWKVTTCSLPRAMQEVVKSEAFVGINGESWGCVIEGECGSEAILHVGCDPHALTTIRCEPRVALSAAHLSVKNDTLAFREERAPEPGPWQLPLRWAKEGYDINAQFQKSEFRSSSKKQVIMPPAIDCVVDVS